MNKVGVWGWLLLCWFRSIAGLAIVHSQHFPYPLRDLPFGTSIDGDAD
jgi:hypothetical protein